ncbi:MAG: cation:proton antiporter [Sulfurospirillaceae bacterium]|nr:cation:proton antiporter [Sulfurospirillaceae bacterium]MCK9546158.1 cation:proton antiporter [Sulfurospirillaceae bacterium]
MNELSILIVIAVILFTSPYFSKILRIPIPPIEIMLGILAGYLGLLSNHYLFETVAEVGFFYLMFLAGTEVNLRVFVTMDKEVIKQGLVYLALLYILAFIFTSILGLNPLLIVILPLLSIGLILALYKEYGKDEPWLNISMFVGIMGELVSIALLTFSGAMLEFGIGIQLYTALLYLSGFIVLIFVVFRSFQVLFWWYPELKILLMPHHDKEEKDIRLSMALFVAMIAIMILLKLEVVFGAFIAGTFIATFFEHKKELPHKLSSFGFGFLVPIFFIYIGSTLPVEALVMDGVIETALVITGAMIVIRQISAVSFWRYLGVQKSILFGLSHSMPLTLLIAVATIGYKSGTIPEDLYFAFILASLVEVIVAMVSIKVIINFFKKR